MANYLTDVSVEAVMDALGDWLAPFVPGGEIIRGEINRTPMPADPFVVLTEILQVRLGRPGTTYHGDAQTETIQEPTRIDVQADFYGEASGEYCKAVKAAFSTLWGWDQFPTNIKPLYTDDGRQAPMINGEQQYERRWILTLSLQYNPSVILPMGSALGDDIQVNAIYVEGEA